MTSAIASLCLPLLLCSCPSPFAGVTIRDGDTVIAMRGEMGLGAADSSVDSRGGITAGFTGNSGGSRTLAQFATPEQGEIVFETADGKKITVRGPIATAPTVDSRSGMFGTAARSIVQGMGVKAVRDIALGRFREAEKTARAKSANALAEKQAAEAAATESARINAAAAAAAANN